MPVWLKAPSITIGDTTNTIVAKNVIFDINKVLITEHRWCIQTDYYMHMPAFHSCANHILFIKLWGDITGVTNVFLFSFSDSFGEELAHDYIHGMINVQRRNIARCTSLPLLKTSCFCYKNAIQEAHRLNFSPQSHFSSFQASSHFLKWKDTVETL